MPWEVLFLGLARAPGVRRKDRWFIYVLKAWKVRLNKNKDFSDKGTEDLPVALKSGEINCPKNN